MYKKGNEKYERAIFLKNKKKSIPFKIKTIENKQIYLI
jgi:hypothetical protein